MGTNITIRVDEKLARQAKVMAARQGTSLSAMATEWLRAKVARDSEYEKARKADLKLLRKGLDIGTGGRATWTREELHER